MSKIKVCQAANTSDFDLINGISCLNYWQMKSPNLQEPICYCRAKRKEGTADDPLVGGHVIGLIGGVPHIFITPILNSVNVSDEPRVFEVNMDDLVRVPNEDELAILADNENKKRTGCLQEILRMIELNK